MALGLFHYQLLTEVLEKIHYIHDESEMADTVLSGVAGALSAEGGSIFKILPDGEIIPLAAYGAPLEVLKKAKFAVGKGVVGWVAEFNQPVKVDNPAQDRRFQSMIDNTTGFKTRSILAAPILSRGNAIGVIEFLNRRGGPFAAADLELISMVGREIGIAFENVRLFERLEESRAIAEAIVNSLVSGVLVMDRQFRLREMNPAAQKLLLLRYAESDKGPELVKDVLTAYPELTQILNDIETTHKTIAGQEMTLMIGEKPTKIVYTAIPIFTPDGTRLGSAILFREPAP